MYDEGLIPIKFENVLMGQLNLNFFLTTSCNIFKLGVIVDCGVLNCFC